MVLCDLLQLGHIASHQDRIGNQARPVRQLDTSLLSNRQDGTDQVLIQPHTSGHSVHDDADPLLVHSILPSYSKLPSDLVAFHTRMAQETAVACLRAKP